MDDLELRKINEYNRYLPQNALQDARLDIEQDSIKIFYLDIYEAPEPMTIDADPQKLKVYQSVYIGTGCTDPYHSEDCPAEYRKAMENAISYGTKYNKTIADHFNLKSEASLGQPSNATTEFIGDLSDRHGIQMELRGHPADPRGRDVWVDGSGNVLVRSVRGTALGLEEKIYPMYLDKKDVERILNAFISKDFITLEIPEQIAPPDQGRPEIILTHSLGQHRALKAWDPPLPGSGTGVERFRSIYREFLRLETMAMEFDVTSYKGMYGQDSPWEEMLKKQKNERP